MENEKWEEHIVIRYSKENLIINKNSLWKKF